MPGDADIFEFREDQPYFSWLATHPFGFVLSLRPGKGPLLHSASCPHIDRHNNPGALTTRGVRKLCAATVPPLRAWAQREGVIRGVVLPKCPDCSP